MKDIYFVLWLGFCVWLGVLFADLLCNRPITNSLLLANFWLLSALTYKE